MDISMQNAIWNWTMHDQRDLVYQNDADMYCIHLVF